MCCPYRARSRPLNIYVTDSLTTEMPLSLRLVMDGVNAQVHHAATRYCPINSVSNAKTQQCHANWRQDRHMAGVDIGLLWIDEGESTTLAAVFIHAINSGTHRNNAGRNFFGWKYFRAFKFLRKRYC